MFRFNPFLFGCCFFSVPFQQLRIWPNEAIETNQAPLQLDMSCCLCGSFVQSLSPVPLYCMCFDFSVHAILLFSFFLFHWLQVYFIIGHSKRYRKPYTYLSFALWFSLFFPISLQNNDIRYTIELDAVCFFSSALVKSMSVHLCTMCTCMHEREKYGRKRHQCGDSSLNISIYTKWNKNQNENRILDLSMYGNFIRFLVTFPIDGNKWEKRDDNNYLIDEIYLLRIIIYIVHPPCVWKQFDSIQSAYL